MGSKGARGKLHRGCNHVEKKNKERRGSWGEGVRGAIQGKRGGGGEKNDMKFRVTQAGHYLSRNDGVGEGILGRSGNGVRVNQSRLNCWKVRRLIWKLRFGDLGKANVGKKERNRPFSDGGGKKETLATNKSHKIP